MTNFPHVSEFSSMPDLVKKLASLDRRAVASSMRKTHGEICSVAVKILALGLHDLLKPRDEDKIVSRKILN